MTRTFHPGDPDPGDVEAVRTARGSTYHRNRHNRWCHERHVIEAADHPTHIGASWETLTNYLGPLTVVEAQR